MQGSDSTEREEEMATCYAGEQTTKMDGMEEQGESGRRRVQ